MSERHTKQRAEYSVSMSSPRNVDTVKTRAAPNDSGVQYCHAKEMVEVALWQYSNQQANGAIHKYEHCETAC